MKRYTWIVLFLGLNAFGAESRGFLVKDPVTNEIKKVENSAMSRGQCKAGECEKNWVYHSMFSSKPKPVIPEPSPSPIAEPKPSYTPKSIPVGEKFDYSHESVNLSKAWSYTQGKETVVVATVDSGAELSHPDLKSNILPGYDFVLNKAGVVDGSFHGTHVAGSISAGLNGFGMFGAAPFVKVLPLRFLDNSGSGDTANAIKAFTYAINAKVDVINCSFGGGGYSSFLHDKIKEATAKGIIVVFASGNSAQNVDKNPSYPGSLPEVISVASSTPLKNLSSFSNYGTTVTLSAPGSNILSTYKGGTLAYLSGTSMSAPLVSAVMALAKSIDKSLTTEKAKQLLCATGQPFAAGKTKCKLLDAGAFISAVALDAK